MERYSLPIAQSEDRMQRPVTREPWHKSGDDEGPKSPDVKRPDPSDLLKRMRRVDPEQARRYRQRSGE
jgi:hypothetical protein